MVNSGTCSGSVVILSLIVAFNGGIVEIVDGYDIVGAKRAIRIFRLESVHSRIVTHFPCLGYFIFSYRHQVDSYKCLFRQTQECGVNGITEASKRQQDTNLGLSVDTTYKT